MPNRRPYRMTSLCSKYAAPVALLLGTACGTPGASSGRNVAESTAAVDRPSAAESLALVPKPACAAMATPTVALTRYERCTLRAFTARCASADSCMIRCLTSGNGRNIGGGCWHVCYAYSGVPMNPLPPGQEACEALSDSIPDSAAALSP